MPPIVITDWSGGRNGVDSPVDPKFPNNQCVEAMNLDFSRGPLGRRRGGSVAAALTGGTANTTAIRKLMRHVAGAAQGSAELWSTDAASPPLVKRLAGGTAWADVSLADSISVVDASTVPLIQGVSFNGKFFLFYPSAVDRSHVWNGTSVRRMGLQAPTAAPTVADTGGGTYAAIARYYRIRWLEMNGVLIVRRSEPGPASTIFTPSGAGLAARVTRPTAPGEGETHWEAEASADGINWWQIVSAEITNQIVIATTTFDDTNDPTKYANGTYAVAPITGSYSLVPSCAFGLTDGNRLIMAGNPTLSARVWWTVVLGSENKGDDERTLNTADIKGYTDLNEKDGGGLTGLGGPVNSVILAFKYRQIWKLTPTGNVNSPYIARLMTRAIGAINSASIVFAEDSAGNPCVYFMSHKGPYRYSLANGLEYLGRDIEDQWRGFNGKSKVNLNATFVSHAMYYSELGQIWWWVATGASNSPDTILMLDIKNADSSDKYGVRGGWSIFTGDIAASSSAAMFSNTPGATMSMDQKPYIARQSAVTILKADTTDGDDNGTGFQAYAKSKGLLPAEMFGKRTTTLEAQILADAATGVTLRATLDRDFGVDTGSFSDVSLTPAASETKVIRKFGDLQQSDLGVVQIQIGDAASQSATQWSIDQLEIQMESAGDN